MNDSSRAIEQTASIACTIGSAVKWQHRASIVEIAP